MTRDRLRDGGILLLLLLLGLFQFPGRTFLQSDTQIYIPILEHLRDPSVLSNDLVATHPHVSYTIYDEAALVLAGLTRLPLETVLMAQQVLFRAVGLLAVYWIAGSFGLQGWMALLVTAVYGLGATVAGPAVLTIEYEPVPRGFALPMVLLAIALAARGRWLQSGLAAAVGLLYHAPTVLPYVVVYSCLSIWPRQGTPVRRRLLGAAPFVAAAALLAILACWQPGAGETQLFWSRIDPEWEKLQRMRGAYNWISGWGDHWIRQYEFLTIVCLAAWWRLRALAPQPLRLLTIGLTIYGALSMPLSWALLEGAKWSLMPQVQPARAVLFLSLLATVMAAIAGVHAARGGKPGQALLWFLVAFAVPSQSEALRTLLPDLRHALWQRRFAATLIAAGLATLAAWAAAKGRRWAAAPALAALAAPYFLIPHVGKISNYPTLETRPLAELADWARQNTAPQAVFLFADADKSLEPGVFRARARRALYVDWKAGGQLNLLRAFSSEWWRRWQQAMAPGFQPSRREELRRLGIDYVVLLGKNRLADLPPEYQNADYVVYRLSGNRN